MGSCEISDGDWVMSSQSFLSIPVELFENHSLVYQLGLREKLVSSRELTYGNRF